MAFDVRVTDRATRRLAETVAYIHYVCGNAEYASLLIDSFERATEALKTQDSFRIVDQPVSDLVGETVYRVKIGRYRIVYRIKDPRTILIFMFIHEAWDLTEEEAAAYHDLN